MFCSPSAPPSLLIAVSVEWYSDSGGPDVDSCYVKQWMGEYRGIAKALIHSHIPFNIQSSPQLVYQDLHPYKVILLPDIQAMSDNEAQLFLRFVSEGGTLIMTGGNPSGLNEYGDERSEYALYELLRVSKSQLNGEDSKTIQYGMGRAVWYRQNVGWDYIKEDEVFIPNKPSPPVSENYKKIVDPILAWYIPMVTLTDAHRCIHLEATQQNDHTLILQFTNFIAVCETNPNERSTEVFPIQQTKFGVSVRIESGIPTSSVKKAAPEQPSLMDIPFTLDVNECTVITHFDIELYQYAIITVQL